ncbi:MAG: ferredoxin--nitrite reductase, partial [Haloferacaceae archaeon]
PDDLDVVRMHMSGCSASCAQPQVADVGFRGETVQVDDPEGTTDEEGDDIVEGMDVGLGGSLGADNGFIDWVETAVPARSVIPALEQFFDAYVDERADGERFYAWCRRVGNDRLRTVMRGADANVSGGVAHEEANDD